MLVFYSAAPNASGLCHVRYRHVPPRHVDHGRYYSIHGVHSDQDIFDNGGRDEQHL